MRRHKKYRQYSNLIGLCLIVYLFNGLSLSVSGKDVNEEQVVRVVCSDMQGDTAGSVHTGYACEYLREIAKFTGWEYEFVEADFDESIEMLEKGEVDLVGKFPKDSVTETLFEFPKYDVGSTYTTLAVLGSNAEISSLSYKTLEGIKVGTYETSQENIDKFITFCNSNEIKDVNIILYQKSDANVLNRALASGEVNAILGNDEVVMPEQRVVLRLAPVPQYFVGAKGNTELCEQLDDAISKIKQIEPDYDEKLYQKYFANNIKYNLSLTQQERTYIQGIDALRVAYIDEQVPIQGFNQKEGVVEGVAIDVVKEIARRLNVEIDWVKSRTYYEAFCMLQEGKVDMLGGMPNEPLLAEKYDIRLTKPYTNIPSVIVGNNLKEMKDYKILALPKTQKWTSTEAIEGEVEEVIFLDTIGDCIRAVNKGTADLTIGNMYAIFFEVQTNYYPHIELDHNTKNSSELLIGISDKADVALLSSINKALLSLETSTISEILYDNIAKLETKVSLTTLFLANSEWVTRWILIIVTIIMGLIYIILRQRINNMKESNQVLQEKAQKDTLTGVYNCGTFEEIVMEHLEKDKGTYFATLFIMDIDNFKQVNDKLGHRAGDAVIKKLARNLEMVFSEGHIIGRLGGDEFEVFMVEVDKEKMAQVTVKAVQLRDMMDTEIEGNNGVRVPISISVGICIAQTPTSFSEMYEQADATLYEVKGKGKNNYKIKIIK